MKHKSSKSKIAARAVALVCSIFFAAPAFAAIPQDRGIVSDDVADTYQGKLLGDTIRNNLNFGDVPSSHWAKEAVSRLGALGIVQGYRENNHYAYRPNQKVSKEEALALLLRAIGKEADAKKEAERRGAENGESNLVFWSKGYLAVARQLGTITANQFNDALSPEQAGLNAKVNFRRTDNATREEVATWLVKLLAASGSAEMTPVYENQAIFAYNDWKNISPQYLPYVEAVSRAKIMQGSGNNFLPKQSISRAEIAQTIANLGQKLYSLQNIKQKNGYIGHVEDDTTLGNSESLKQRIFLVRDQDGKVDKWIYQENKDANGKKTSYSAPVIKYGNLTTLLGAIEGDKVEYLVDDNGGLLYVKVGTAGQAYTFSGSLQPFDNLDKGEITLKDGDNTYRFKMTSSLYKRNPDRIAMRMQYNNRYVDLADMPYSHRITVTVKDALVTEIEYAGDIIRRNEISGIIKDIQSQFKYVVIETWDGKIVNKKYRTSDLAVEKKPHYDNTISNGYLDEMFRHYKWDVKDARIEDLEVGDMVHATLSDEDREYITRISASTNYIADFGQIVELRERGDLGMDITVRHPDSSLSTYTVDPLASVFYGEQRSGLPRLKVGQNVKLLINQAVIRPGTLKETVKEISVDKLGNQVANVYKGNIGLLNQAQKQLTLNHSYQLQHSHWDDYQASRVFAQNENTKYYYNGKRVTADYVRKYLYSPNITGYAVTTKFYSGEVLDTLSFRDSRETMLGRDKVSSINDSQRFRLEDYNSPIQTDEGTIIIKDNHIVSFGSVLPPDYSRVILNGDNKAALIEITPQPANDSLQIFRGRIAKIDETKSFSVQSNSALNGMVWTYSPIKRQFEMDYRTLIYAGGKYIPQAEFLSYSEISHTNKVYNIIADGTKAKYVLDQPYLQEGIKGVIYQIDKDSIKLKDIYVYQKSSKKWVPLSLTNNYGEATVHSTALFFRQNEVAERESLKVGEVIRVMTTEDLVRSLRESSDRSVEGYLFFIEQ